MPRPDIARIVVATALLPAVAASAGIVSAWIDPGGGGFSDAANWSAGVPGALDTALFDLRATYAVDLAVPASVQRLIVRRGSVDLALAALLDATSSSALLPSIVVGDTADRSPSLAILGQVHGRFMDIASGLFGSGTVMVGPGASLDLDQVLSVGPRGAAAFTVDGGTLACLRLVAGALDTGDAEVAVHDGTLVADDAIIVAQKGVASLRLDLGTNATSGDGIVAMSPLSDGTMLVDGVGTTLDLSGTLDIGRNGEGVLEITNGATVSVGEFVTVGTIPASFIFPYWPAGDGLVLVEGDGSLLTVGGDLYVPLGGIGTVDLRSGGRIEVAGDLVLNSSADSLFRFALKHAGPVPIIDVAGDVVGEGSSMVLSLADGFTPSPDEPFILIAATNIVANFDATLETGPGFIWSFIIGPLGDRAAVYAMVQAIPDLNGDGIVDGADLGLLLGNWGGTGLGDLNGDGVVDGGDLGGLLAAWSG
ncbi:MAG: hypothetical protein U0575_15300 [Phycisphaerales bacterium]